MAYVSPAIISYTVSGPKNQTHTGESAPAVTGSAFMGHDFWDSVPLLPLNQNAPHYRTIKEHLPWTSLLR